jgi:hypothetical protein
MKRRPPSMIEVFSLSAIDIFASAMGAFVIISIILMRDYQKEVVAEGDLTHLEQMVENVSDQIVESESIETQLRESIASARAQLSEIESVEQELLDEFAKATQTIVQKAPEEEEANVSTQAQHQVTFRILGMKTAKQKLMVVFDMNKYLAAPQGRALLEKTVTRIIDSMQEYHEFALLGYQFVGGREIHHRWPQEGGFEVATEEAKANARAFAASSMNELGGGNSLLGAVETGIRSGAEALFVVSDGLAGPSANRGMQNLRYIANKVGAENRKAGNVEINTVIIGEFFDYESIVVETMERIARENQGSFMALLP